MPSLIILNLKLGEWIPGIQMTCLQVEILGNRLPSTLFRQSLLSMLTEVKPRYYPAFLGLLILTMQENLNSIVDERLCAR